MKFDLYTKFILTVIANGIKKRAIIYVIMPDLTTWEAFGAKHVKILIKPNTPSAADPMYTIRTHPLCPMCG